MDAQKIIDDVKLALRRIARCDFQREKATDAERARLAPSVTDAQAQDYVAWRRSVLMVAGFLLSLTLLLSLIGYQSVEAQFIEMEIGLAKAQGHTFRESEVAPLVRRHYGQDNLDTLEFLNITGLIAAGIAAAFAVLAARGWTDVRRSRRMARLGWYALVGVPLAVALVPWMRFLDFGHLGAEQQAQLKASLGGLLGLSIFLSMAPKLLAIFPGLMRASITVKTLLHESAVPGYTAGIFAPVYAVMLVLVFAAVNQAQGDFKLLFGIVALLGGAGIYLLRGRDILRSHAADEVQTIVAGVRKTALLFNLLGIVLVAVWLFDLPGVEFFQVFEFFLAAAGGLLLMLAVGSDFVVAIIAKEHDQAKRFQASALVADFEGKIAGLSAAGLGDLSVRETRTEDTAPGSA